MKYLFILLISIFSISILNAQDSTGTQFLQAVSFDSGNKLLKIDASAESRLQLFPEIMAFQSAVVYQLPDSSYSVEIISNDKLLRRPLSKYAFQELRGKVDSRLMELALSNTNTNEIVADSLKRPKSLRDNRGRVDLIITSSIMSIFYYAPFAASIKGLEPSQRVGMYSLVMSTGVIAPLLLTRNIEVTKGMGAMASVGAYSGILYGAAFNVLLFGNEAGETISHFAVAGSIAGLVGGSIYAYKKEISYGKANMIGWLGGLYGPLAGLCFTGIVGVGDNIDIRIPVAIVLASGVGGVLLANKLTSLHNYADGDARVFGLVSTLSLFSAYSALIATDYMQLLDGTTLSGIGLFGIAAGTFLGDRLVRNVDFTYGEGQIISLTTFAGAVFGLSMGLLAEPQLIPISVCAGAAGGLAFGYIDITRENGFFSKIKIPNFKMGLALLNKGHNPNGISNDITPGLSLSMGF